MRHPVPTRTARLLRTSQWVSLGAGSLLLLIYLGARVETYASSSSALTRFDEARQALETGAVDLEKPAEALSVDKTLWSPGRIAKYEEGLAHDPGLPLAILHIPSIELRVPVFAGTGEVVLNRAVGHITGTALPSEPGNVALAAHRDGFFRRLKDLEVGDLLVLETLRGEERFVAEQLRIVGPDEVSVLDATPTPALTLVTCYPFYFVGPAPRRFIVRAYRESED